jgi:hypothetical protein
LFIKNISSLLGIGFIDYTREHINQVSLSKDLQVSKQAYDNNLRVYRQSGAFTHHYVKISHNECVPHSVMARASTVYFNSLKLSNLEYTPCRLYKYPFFERVALVQKDIIIKTPNDESLVKALMSPMVHHYFKMKHGFLASSESKSGIGIIDFHIKYLPRYSREFTNSGGIELKSFNGDSLNKLFKQGFNYAEHDTQAIGSYIICVKPPKIFFFYINKIYIVH